MSEQLHDHQEIDGQLLLSFITQVGANMQLYREISAAYPQKFGRQDALMEAETQAAYQAADAVVQTNRYRSARWDHELIGQGSGILHQMIYTSAKGECTFMVVPDGGPSVVGVPVTAVVDLSLRNS